MRTYCRVFTDIIKLRSGHPGVKWALNSMAGDLVREIWTQGNRHTETEDSHVKMDPETGVMGLQGKDCRQPQKLERSRQGSSLEPLERGSVALPIR